MYLNFFVVIFFIGHITLAQVSDFKSVDFTQADYIAKLNKGAGLENLPLLVHNLTHSLQTDVEKFRAIYVWVCHNIKGDMMLDSKVLRKRKKHKDDSLAYLKWNNAYLKTVFKKLLKHKKTMCTGYAYLIKELCFLANIECHIIDGYGRSVSANVKSLDLVNHSWNAVRLNNKWYLCDATWSSGYMINNIFFYDYNDGYFLTHPDLFAQNHYPVNKNWLLIDSLKHFDYTAKPLVYGETFEHKIEAVQPNLMNLTISEEKEVTFSYKVLKKLSDQQISLVYYQGETEKHFKIYNLKNENGFMSFTSKFDKKGIFDTHLKINEDIVMSYVIEVSKG